MSGAYYNEHDPFAAAWLRQLIKAKLIADGEVDERSIELVQPGDVRGFVQCHFFAGIGGWSYALRLAGWPDEQAVWTGSCPCQPFSSAGAQVGGDDPRHLWPAWFRLISECCPDVLFGEQVESAIGHGWLDLVCDDLERENYAVGAVDLPAASVGAPHIRARVWFVADAAGERRTRERLLLRAENTRPSAGTFSQAPRSGEVGELADSTRRNQRRYSGESRSATDAGSREARATDGHSVGGASELGHSNGARGRRNARAVSGAKREGYSERREPGCVVDESELAGAKGHTDGKRETAERGLSGRPSTECSGGPWTFAEWLPCRDGKSRPVEPGTFPLAHGIPARVGRLRGYGNAVVPQVAAAFIGAYLDTLPASGTANAVAGNVE